MTPKQYQSAVYFIGAVLILCVGGIIAITLLTDDSIPDVLQNVAVGSLTGLVGLLVTPQQTVQQVEVVKREDGHVDLGWLGLIALIAGVVVLLLLGLNVIDIQTN